MTPTWLDDAKAARLLRYAAGVYLVAWVVHTGDHLRRGLEVTTLQVEILGNTAAVFQVIAIAAVFGRRAWAPLTAVLIGLPDGIGIAAVHLLPKWSSFSDAFPGARGTGVTTLSWIAAVVESVSALVFAAAGVYALRRSRERATRPLTLQRS